MGQKKASGVQVGDLITTRDGQYIVENVKYLKGGKILFEMQTVAENLCADNLASGPKLRKSGMYCDPNEMVKASSSTYEPPPPVEEWDGLF